MAELNPPLGTTTPEIFLDNVKRADKLVNGPEGTVNDRGGEPLDTWRQMMAKNDEIRQNLIPLSRQYMKIEAAQADIANIPEGSTTYVRSGIGSALADEYINNSGTLEPTGRKMPSQQAVQINDDFRVDVTLGSESQWVDNSSSSAKTTIMADASGREVIYANHSAKKNNSLWTATG